MHAASWRIRIGNCRLGTFLKQLRRVGSPGSRLVELGDDRAKGYRRRPPCCRQRGDELAVPSQSDGWAMWSPADYHSNAHQQRLVVPPNECARLSKTGMPICQVPEDNQDQWNRPPAADVLPARHREIFLIATGVLPLVELLSERENQYWSSIGGAGYVLLFCRSSFNSFHPSIHIRLRTCRLLQWASELMGLT